MTVDAFDPSEVRRAKSTIYVNSICCAGWVAINAAGAWLLGAPRLLGLSASALAMMISWAVALRDLRGGRVMRGVLNYVVSGLLLLLAMSLSVPDMGLLFVFATFIFLAFGLSYADRAASLWIVSLTLAVAAIMLVTSLGLRWTSGIDTAVIRWVNLVGMTMALAIDATQFIGLRTTLQARGERLREGAARLEIVSNAAHEFASASGDVEALLELVSRRIAETIGNACAVRLIGDDREWLEPSTSFYHRDPDARNVARKVLGTERQRVGDGIAGRVAATGHAELVAELDDKHLDELAARPFREMLCELGVASVLAISLRSNGRTTGVISMLRTERDSPYTVDDQRLAQDLADRAGLAIDNAVLVATLEQRVRERTAEIEVVNRDLEAFSYSVSHDLRAPLRTIDGFSRALVDDCADRLDDDGRQYLSRIRAGTQRMTKLIDDLLGLARIGRAPLQIGVVDASRIAGEIVAEMRNRDPERAIATTIAPGLTVRADPRLVTIVLENLLGNAWKFTARTSNPAIEVGAIDGALFVRDNGAGFDMAYAAKLFAPFQRLHPTEEFAGDGIGLATVARIVAHHTGRVWAEAAVGRGATFFFTLGDHR
ncbi:MAG TPA: ATP-binding protein [Kofleriaceae bacterium]|nr:ATP-binding protein [Kofleriaceae bacterium]